MFLRSHYPILPLYGAKPHTNQNPPPKAETVVDPTRNRHQTLVFIKGIDTYAATIWDFLATDILISVIHTDHGYKRDLMFGKRLVLSKLIPKSHNMLPLEWV